ncbi:MAG: polyprenyl diphosphate synthase [Alphaproteobacteria bacterium]
MSLPAHIAIIMDGNSRWAEQRGINRARGHTQGGEVLKNLLSECRKRPYIKYLTLYTFSIENWNRTADEISDLMNLMRHYIKREAPTLHENNFRMRFVGELQSLEGDIQRDLTEVAALTAKNTGLVVTMAISYGARQELAAAMRNIADKVAAGTLAPNAIDEKIITSHLYSHDIPDPDLLIRTGGEERLSNFLLWQSAYTELYFTNTLWPDFTADDMDKAIASYSRRERRFGQRKAG